MDSKWVIYGFLGGNIIKELSLTKLFVKRISLNFSGLR